MLNVKVRDLQKTDRKKQKTDNREQKTKNKNRRIYQRKFYLTEKIDKKIRYIIIYKKNIELLIKD